MTSSAILTHYTTVNACGRGLQATLDALVRGRSGLRPYDFGGSPLDTYIGRVAGVEESPLEEPFQSYDCRNNRLAKLALNCDGFAERVEAAKARYGPDRIGVIMGTSTSGVGEGEKAYLERATPTSPLPESFNFDHTHDFFSLPRFVSAYLGLSGPAMTVSAACASSNKVFADALQWMAAGLCDAVVVGGVDSLCHLTIRGFNALELLSRGPCRPNDARRSGISISEAAGFALIEPQADPTDERSQIALLGYGESSDAYHMSSPHPEGKGASLAMQAALANAGLAPGAIDYINLHGTGSTVNDRVEDLAIHGIFGGRTPTSSTKGWTGHALGAAGITEVVISCLCLEHGLVPGTLNMNEVDPDFRCAVQAETVARPLSRVLTNSFGFGGNNCSLVLGRAP